MGIKSVQNVNLHDDRIGEERCNKSGCLMKIIEYNGNNDLIVEFQDEYHYLVHTDYKSFKNGSVRNPYHPKIYGVVATGSKYKTRYGNETTKEYLAWYDMLRRCFDKKYKKNFSTYKDVTCCKEWLLFENFYEWLHEQDNFDKWLNNKKWCLDKDILKKGNKIYSPYTCCLVPMHVNNLFIKNNKSRNGLPIGVSKTNKNKYVVNYRNGHEDISRPSGYFSTINEAFEAYKEYKENVIKQVAQKEFDDGNITSGCYEAMMKYNVETTD